jgi:hypothetical protein
MTSDIISHIVRRCGRRDVSARFWTKVDKSGDCWVWQGTINKHYRRGLINFDGKLRYAHRVAWKLVYGEYPTLHVCHRCDNTLCVRPDHLFLGDDKVNIHDAIRKGRFTHHRKLTPKQVGEIRSRFPLQHGQQGRLAAEYGVTTGCIRSIRIGRTWADMSLQPE